MVRLLVHVEGETEETFVNEVLRPHLYGYGYHRVDARLLGNARLRSRRGGIRAWHSVRADIMRHLQEDASCLTTTMVDYYGLPDEDGRAWPGRAEAGRQAFYRKAETVEQAIVADLSTQLDYRTVSRFLPFVTMHEFEALLFSDCSAFARGIGQETLGAAFQAIRDVFGTPEEINDSVETAPSKRVERLVPGYEKPFMGTLAVLEIGLEPIREACPHFNGWLERLEAWPSLQT